LHFDNVPSMQIRAVAEKWCAAAPDTHEMVNSRQGG
jgi:hypothetical protein